MRCSETLSMNGWASGGFVLAQPMIKVIVGKNGWNDRFGCSMQNIAITSHG